MMSALDLVGQLKSLREKHLAGQHNQLDHGRKGIGLGKIDIISSLSKDDKNFLLSGGPNEVAIDILDDGSKKRAKGTVDITEASIEIPNNSIAGIHTHRDNSSKLDTGHPELSASDYRVALDRATQLGSYSTTALLPNDGKYTSLDISYDGSQSHKDYVDTFMRMTRDMPGMVGHATHISPVWVKDAEDIGLLRLHYGKIKL